MLNMEFIVTLEDKDCNTESYYYYYYWRGPP
jgi:hypothetical protein